MKKLNFQLGDVSISKGVSSLPFYLG